MGIYRLYDQYQCEEKASNSSYLYQGWCHSLASQLPVDGMIDHHIPLSPILIPISSRQSPSQHHPPLQNNNVDWYMAEARGMWQRHGIFLLYIINLILCSLIICIVCIMYRRRLARKATECYDRQLVI
jgi:hypothetical protein